MRHMGNPPRWGGRGKGRDEDLSLGRNFLGEGIDVLRSAVINDIGEGERGRGGRGGGRGEDTILISGM